MKKIILLFAIVCLLCSCSADESTVSAASAGTRVHKIVVDGDNFHYEQTYLYTGNNLHKILSSEGSYFIFTYTGNLITKGDSYDANNILKASSFYEYDAQQRLVGRKTLAFSNSSGFREVFDYDDKGNATLSRFSGDLLVQNTPSGNTAENYFFSDGLVTKREIFSTDGSPETETHEFTYDGKNHPYNSIPGLYKVFLGTGSGINSTTQNTVAENVTNSMNDSGAVLNTYTYNGANYPVSCSRTFNGNPSTVTHYYYE